MSLPRAPYDFYADMYATHREIGYLLWLLLMVAGCDVGLAAGLACWPQADVYLVQGISGYAEVPVIWGSHLPHLAMAAAGAPSAARAAAALSSHQGDDDAARLRSRGMSAIGKHGGSALLAAAGE